MFNKNNTLPETYVHIVHMDGHTVHPSALEITRLYKDRVRHKSLGRHQSLRPSVIY